MRWIRAVAADGQWCFCRCRAGEVEKRGVVRTIRIEELKVVLHFPHVLRTPLDDEVSRNGMQNADQGLEDDRTDLRSRQSDAPIIDGVVHAVEIQVDSMIVEDQTDENHTREGDRRLEQQTDRRVLVIDTIERQFILDHHQDDAQETEETHQITDHSPIGEKFERTTEIGEPYR